MLTIEEAAARMSTRSNEIAAVEPHDHGTVIVTADGTRTLDCTVPDGAGLTGLMFEVLPAEGVYATPTFTPLEEEADVIVERPPPPPASSPAPTAAASSPVGSPADDPADDTGAPARPPVVGAGSGKAAWVEYATSLGYDTVGLGRDAIVKIIDAGDPDTDAEA